MADSLLSLEPLLKALADANRLKIVCLLAKQEHCVCELVESLDLAQNLISHHLGVLKKNDLVECRREGTNMYYALNAKTAQRMESVLKHVLKK